MKTKLKTKIKNKFNKCILYTILGDTIAFINGFFLYKNILYENVNYYSKINIKGWSYSIDIMFLWFCFVIFQWKKKQYKSNINYNKKYYNYLSNNINTTIYLESKPNSKNNSQSNNSHFRISSYKYSDYFFKHKIAKPLLSDNNIQKYSNCYINRTKFFFEKKNLFATNKIYYLIANKKKIKKPNHNNLLISIILGFYLHCESFSKRSKIAFKYANETHSHPYNNMSVVFLTNLISELLYNNNFLLALLNVNKNIQKIKTKNKYTKLFCKELNCFIKNLNIKYNSKIILNKNYSKNLKNKINSLNIVLIAINSLLISENNWDNLIYYSGIAKNTNNISCAIACCLYILVYNDKQAPKKQLKQIEDYYQFNIVFKY